MDLYGATKTKYDVPLNHLDFSYINSCQNKKELEKIVKILRYVEVTSPLNCSMLGLFIIFCVLYYNV